MMAYFGFLFLFSCFRTDYCQSNVEDPWQYFITQNYTNEVPVTDDGILDMKVVLSITSITSITESKMEFSADLNVAIKWADYRLSNDIEDEYFYDDEMLLIPVKFRKKIWFPKVFLASSRQGDRTDLFIKEGKEQKDDIIVSYFYIKPYYLMIQAKPSVKMFCPFQFHNYPFDVQYCSISLQYVQSTPKDVIQAMFDESVKPLLLDNSPSLQLDISKVTRSYCIVNQSVGNFTCLELKVTFQRRLGTHITQTFIPSSMVVILSWFSFWLDVEAAPARISLGVTALLTLSTSFSQTQSTLPAVAYMKAIDLWMFFCIFCVFMSLVEFTCAYTINKKSKLKENKRSIVQKQIVNCTEKKYAFLVEEKKRNHYLTVLARKVKKTKSMSLDNVARIIFPLSFVIFTCVYMIYYWHKMQQALDK